MKKLIFLILVVVTLTSCNVAVDNTLSKPIIVTSVVNNGSYWFYDTDRLAFRFLGDPNTFQVGDTVLIVNKKTWTKLKK